MGKDNANETKSNQRYGIPLENGLRLLWFKMVTGSRNPLSFLNEEPQQLIESRLLFNELHLMKAYLVLLVCTVNPIKAAGPSKIKLKPKSNAQLMQELMRKTMILDEHI